MVVPLDHDQRVTGAVFGSQIPRLLGSPASAANVQSLPLAKRVERQPLVSAEHLAVGRLDGTGPLIHKLAQKFPERPLPDEADARAVRLIEHRQACASGALPNGGLFQLAEG